MTTRPYLANWECFIEPLESELRQLGGVDFSIAAQTVMHCQRASSGDAGEEKKSKHVKNLLEELTNLRSRLQRATEYANQIIHELETHPPKRRRTIENFTEPPSFRNTYSGDAAGPTGEDAADAHERDTEEDPWKGARNLLSKATFSCCRYCVKKHFLLS